MKSGFEISVVIPTFNRVNLLQRAVDSVLAQTRRPAEIIVVDDGSTDETRKIIEAYGEPVIYVRQENRGVSCARNTGIRLAQGNWIGFLDSDDEWRPEKLETQITALSENPEYDFCHTDEIWIRRGKRVNSMNKHEKSGGYIFEKCLPLCVISPSSVLIRKNVFEMTGLFDESLPACEDYDFWLRYCSQNPVLYIDKPLLVKYGGHEDQLSKKYWGMDRFRITALFKIIIAEVLTEQHKVSAIKMFHEKCDILLKGAEKHGNSELLKWCKAKQEKIYQFGDAKESNAPAVQESIQS